MRSSTHTRLDFRTNILQDHCKLVEWTLFLQRMCRVEWHSTAVWPLTNMSMPFTNIGKIRHLLTQSITEKLVHAFLTARLDYCSSILYSLSQEAYSAFTAYSEHLSTPGDTHQSRWSYNASAPLATRARANHLQGTAAHVQNNPWQRAIILIRVNFKLHSKAEAFAHHQKTFVSARLNSHSTEV